MPRNTCRICGAELPCEDCAVHDICRDCYEGDCE